MEQLKSNARKDNQMYISGEYNFVNPPLLV